MIEYLSSYIHDHHVERNIGRLNEIEEAWNERNPDEAFTSPQASQESQNDNDNSSKYDLTQDSQSMYGSQESGYDDNDDYTNASYSQEYSQPEFSQDGDDQYGVAESKELSKQEKLQKLKVEATSSSLAKVADANTLPIIIKSGAYSKPMLLCECTDPELNFDGDTGAIGRMVVEGEADKSSLVFDLKGRQYRGRIQKGPSILILNTAPPVGAKSDDNEVTARAECIVNEYCKLSFEKDLLSDLKGNYTGLYDLADELLNEVPLDKYGKAAEKKKAAAKKRKGGDDDDDDDDNKNDDDNDRKQKKKAPKISTGRTQSMKGKDGKKKKKAPARKKK